MRDTTRTGARRRLRYGQIGGGTGSFIGGIHRAAVALDGGVDLVAGALCSDPGRARASARDLFIPEQRSYATWQELVQREAARPEEERLDFISIVTPNHLHFAQALACVEAGFHVVIDKPLVHTGAQAQRLVEAVRGQGSIFAITYNYTGYPMVKQARHWVRNGLLGTIRRVVVEYAQGWLREPIDQEGHKQAEWRTDPERAGIGGALGDIGTHCENLMSYVTDLSIAELSADLATFVPGRRLDDDVGVLLRFAPEADAEPARGVLWISQVAAGARNRLTLRVWGASGGLQWDQEDPDRLHLVTPGGEVRTSQTGDPGLCPAAQRASHLFPGAPEGFLGAFANIYRNVADTIRARRSDYEYPDVNDGARGVRFIERVVENARGSAKWTPF